MRGGVQDRPNGKFITYIDNTAHDVPSDNITLLDCTIVKQPDGSVALLKDKAKSSLINYDKLPATEEEAAASSVQNDAGAEKHAAKTQEQDVIDAVTAEGAPCAGQNIEYLSPGEDTDQNPYHRVGRCYRLTIPGNAFGNGYHAQWLNADKMLFTRPVSNGAEPLPIMFYGFGKPLHEGHEAIVKVSEPMTYNSTLGELVHPLTLRVVYYIK